MSFAKKEDWDRMVKLCNMKTSVEAEIHHGLNVILATNQTWAERHPESAKILRMALEDKGRLKKKWLLWLIDKELAEMRRKEDPDDSIKKVEKIREEIANGK